MLADDLDRVLADGYLGDLAALDDTELKERRAECQEVEAKLSFLRRLAQGRLDIVAAERSRRDGGGEAGDLADLVERLPQILADKSRPPGPGRMPTNLVPPDEDDLTAELDAVSGPLGLGGTPDATDEQLRDTEAGLRDLEKRVSGQRRAIFAVIDALQGELARRLEVDPASSS